MLTALTSSLNTSMRSRCLSACVVLLSSRPFARPADCDLTLDLHPIRPQERYQAFIKLDKAPGSSYTIVSGPLCALRRRRLHLIASTSFQRVAASAAQIISGYGVSLQLFLLVGPRLRPPTLIDPSSCSSAQVLTYADKTSSSDSWPAVTSTPASVASINYGGQFLDPSFVLFNESRIPPYPANPPPSGTADLTRAYPLLVPMCDATPSH